MGIVGAAPGQPLLAAAVCPDDEELRGPVAPALEDSACPCADREGLMSRNGAPCAGRVLGRRSAAVASPKSRTVIEFRCGKG